MSLCVVTVGEQAGGLDNEVHVQLAPLQVLRVLLVEDLDAVAVDGDGVIVVGNLAVEATQYGVVLQQVRESLVIGQVVDGNDLKVVVGPVNCVEEVTTNAAKAVNAYAGSHCKSPQRVE